MEPNIGLSEVLICTLCLAPMLGLIPAIIAHNKGSNLILWWLFGTLLFIVALPASIVIKTNQGELDLRQLKSGDVTKCPYCAELVKADAVICRFCGRNVDSTSVLNDVSLRMEDKGLPEVEVMRTGYITVTNKSVRVKSDTYNYMDIAELAVHESGDTHYVLMQTQDGDTRKFGYSKNSADVERLVDVINSQRALLRIELQRRHSTPQLGTAETET